MKGWTPLLLLALAVALVFGAIAYNAHTDPAGTAEEDSGPVTYQGHTLEVPSGWTVYAAGTRGGTLNLRRRGGAATGSLLTINDERTRPEDARRFVSGWQNAVGKPGFNPQSLDEYHDAEVDRAGLRCVAIHWSGTQRTLQTVCLAPSGSWRLTLAGEEPDVPALDALARQMPQLEGTR